MALIGGQINPALYPQPDYRNVIEADRMRAQSFVDVGNSISGVIKDFRESRKEEKEINAANDASVKAIEAALTLSDSYDIAGARDALQPFLTAASDANLSAVQKSALLAEGKAMIPNVFGRFDKNQAMDIEKAQLAASGGAKSVNLQPIKYIENINGQEYEFDGNFNPVTGVRTRMDGSIVGQPRSRNAIDAGLNLPSTEPGVPPVIGDGVLPPRGAISTSAIDSALAMPDGVSSLANVSPLASGAPTSNLQPKVDGPPASMMEIPPGARRIESKAKEINKPVNVTLEKLGELMNLGVRPEGRLNPDGTFDVTDFDTASLPTGMTIKSDGKGGFEMIQGAGVGAAKAEQRKAAAENRIDKAMALTEDLNLLEAKSKSMMPGVLGAVGRMVGEGVPTTDAAERKEIIDRVVATLTLEGIQQMRANNPTGAALGAVSDKDMAVLRNSATALKNAQSPESFRRELVRLKNLQHDLIYGSDRVLKAKLDNGEITQSEFDEAAIKAPSQYIDEKGIVKERKMTIPTSGTPITPDEQMLIDKYKTK
jgi:hypothetical protein